MCMQFAYGLSAPMQKWIYKQIGYRFAHMHIESQLELVGALNANNNNNKAMMRNTKTHSQTFILDNEFSEMETQPSTQI